MDQNEMLLELLERQAILERLNLDIKALTADEEYLIRGYNALLKKTNE